MARSPYLKGLIPDDYLFWHSLDQPGLVDTDAALVADEAGDAHLTAADPEPVWRSHITGENYLDFDGANDPPKSSTGKNFTIKHLFVIASHAGASFPNNAGLFSQRAGADTIFVGEAGTTRFFDIGHTGLEYRKSGALFPQANMQAPMMSSVELLEWMLPGGYAADSVQIGQDRADTARRWLGRFYGALAYSRVLSSSEVDRIRLYAQLKTRNWLGLGETLVFPSPEIIWGETTYSRFKRLPLDFKSITDVHVYEDETRSKNQTNIKPPLYWEVEMNNMSWAQAELLDVFYENVRHTHKFNFYDYRRGEFYTDVEVDSYDRDHQGHESYKNTCRFILVKYGNKASLPYELVDDELPTVTITSPAADQTLTGEVKITVTAADNVAVKRVEYYIARDIGGGVLENHFLGYAAAVPFSFIFDTTEFDDADNWTISAYAVDTSDNYSNPSQVGVDIDNTPAPDEEAPTLPSNALSLNGVPTTSSIPLKWLAGSDNVAVTGYRVTYATDVGFTSPLTKTVGNVLTTNLTGLVDTTDYWMYVQARDLAGNWSANSNVLQTATAPAGTGGMAQGLQREGAGVSVEGEGRMRE